MSKSVGKTINRKPRRALFTAARMEGQQIRLVKERDGRIVELRPGYRPRVLSKEEVEALREKHEAGDA